MAGVAQHHRTSMSRPKRSNVVVARSLARGNFILRWCQREMEETQEMLWKFTDYLKNSSFRLHSTLRFCLYSTLIFKYKYSLRRFAIDDFTMEYWACCGVSISCWRGERTTRNPFHSLFAFCRRCWWEYKSCSVSDGMRQTEDNRNIFKINDKFTLHEFKVILLLSSCSSTSLSFILRRLTISLVYHISSSLSSCCCCCLFRKVLFYLSGSLLLRLFILCLSWATLLKALIN